MRFARVVRFLASETANCAERRGLWVAPFATPSPSPSLFTQFVGGRVYDSEQFGSFSRKTDQTDDRWSEWCYSVLVHHGGHGGRGQSFGGGGGGGLPSLFGSFFFPRSPWSLFLGAPPFALPPRKIPSFPSKMSASDVGPAGWAPLGPGGGGGRVPGDAGGVMPEPTGGLGASSDAGSRRGSLLGGGGGGCELSSASPASVSLALIPPSAAILDGERGWCVSRPARSGFEFLLFLLCRFSG